LIEALAMTRLAAAVLLGVGLAVTACSTSGRGRVESERAAWVKTRPAAYRFTYEVIAYSPEAGIHYQVHVRDGRVASAEPLDSKERATRDPARHPTLDGLFEQILEAYDRKAEEVEVSFDPTYHFPVKASVDGRKDTSDDEWRVEVSGFAPEK
jgi:hypothetical protein